MTATVEMPASEHDRKMSELARLQYANEDQAEKLAALRAENARLREALRICNNVLHTPSGMRSRPNGTSDGTAIRAIEAALAATGAR